MLDRLRPPGSTPRWAVCALVALTACTALDSPYPTEGDLRVLVVHGMLVADTADQELLVEYTREIEDGLYRGLTPATGAVVTLESDGAVHVFTEDDTEPGRYRARFTPRAGEGYRLRIEGPTGESVSAETVIPGTPRITVPSADTAVDIGQSEVFGDTVRVHWTAATGAAGYIVVRRLPMRDEPAYHFSDLYFSRLDVFQDTTSWILIGGAPTYPGGARLNIAAVDSNYARYVALEPIETVPESRARSPLEGGYGFFGSVAFSQTRTVLVHREP